MKILGISGSSRSDQNSGCHKLVETVLKASGCEYELVSLRGKKILGRAKTWGDFESFTESTGRYTFKFITGGLAAGQSFVKDGKVCYVNDGDINKTPYCYTLYRNPTGTLEERNQYAFVTPADVFTFSVSD